MVHDNKRQRQDPKLTKETGQKDPFDEEDKDHRDKKTDNDNDSDNK